MIYNSDEQFLYDQTLNFDRFSNAIPFIMDVLAHLIFHYDDKEGIHWIDEGSKDYFNF